MSQLFAFYLHSINGVNPHSRCVCFLLVSLRMGPGSPGSRGAQCMAVVHLEEQEEITKLSQTGPACCPAAVSSCMVATSKGQMSTARPRAIAGTGGLSPVQGTRELPPLHRTLPHGHRTRHGCCRVPLGLIWGGGICPICTGRGAALPPMYSKEVVCSGYFSAHAAK